MLQSNYICNNYLTAHHALPQSDQIGLTPSAFTPGRDLTQVLVEIEVCQLIVQEIADVPR